jgi:hypothetical protein
MMTLQQLRSSLNATAQYQKGNKEWWDEWPLTHAATFHLDKKCFDARLNHRIKVEYKATIKHFSNVLNKLVFNRSERWRGAKLAIVAVKQRNTERNKTDNAFGYHCHLAIGGFPKGCDPIALIREAALKTRCISKKKALFNDESIKVVDEQYPNHRTGECGLPGWTSYTVRYMRECEDILIEQPFEAPHGWQEKVDNMVETFFPV